MGIPISAATSNVAYFLQYPNPRVRVDCNFSHRVYSKVRVDYSSKLPNGSCPSPCIHIQFH